MAQDHGLCRKREKSQKPAHGPPLQAHVAAANGTVLQLANMLLEQLLTTILAHMEMNKGKQNEQNGAKQT